MSLQLQVRHSWHTISNQIWLWNITLTLAMIPLIAMLFANFGDLLAPKRWSYLAAYGSIPVGIALVQVWLFWWGNSARPYLPTPFPDSGARGDSPADSFTSPRLGGGWEGATARRTLALHVLIASDCLMLWLFSLLIGTGGGIHFLFPAALALPFYFFRREIQPQAWTMKGVWIGIILLQFVAAIVLLDLPSPTGRGAGGEGGLQPLPAAMLRSTRTVVVMLSLLIAAIWLAWFCWQFRVSRRLMTWWDNISYQNMPAQLSQAEREWHSLVNRIIFLGFAFWLILYAGGLTIALVQILIAGESAAFIRHGILAVAPHVIVSVALAYLYTRFAISTFMYNGSIRIKQVFITTVLLGYAAMWFWGCFLLPLPIPFSLYCFLLPILAITLSPPDSLFFTVIQVIGSIVFGIVGLYVQLHGTPLFPLPNYVAAWTLPTSIIGIMIVLIASAYYSRHESDKSKSALNTEREKNAELHQQSEKLLLNILPAQVSEELKSHGRTTPREYPSATVLFTDFVGFTRIAERLTAVDLVRELDQCFSYFDSVAEKYGLEKLKTIGDAYMAVAGIPVENNTHPIDCALAALEIQSFMNQMKEIKEQQGFPYWELRLGMHTGPLVAGVVGEKKFAYDVWGDTVNTASRMESSGEPGAINISREMFDRVRFLFECEFRGKVYAKNKGEIEMYFLRGLKPKYSVSGLGRVPNRDFKDLYDRIKNGAKLVAK